MSDPKKKPEPDEELLEFLGDIDESNGDADDDFPRFLADNDIHELATPPKKPQPPPPPAKDANHE
ncbi:MAG TPA: hypothetical protein VMF52_01815 [Steroidobacteraceae bacterium]|nr:hypothetical protein [Steroidobacteraceae bacterium]